MVISYRRPTQSFVQPRSDSRAAASSTHRASGPALLLWATLLLTIGGCGRWGFEVASQPAAQIEGDGKPSPHDMTREDAGTSVPFSEAGPLDDSGATTAPDDAGTLPSGDAEVGSLVLGAWQTGQLPYASGAATSAVLSDGLHYLGGASDYFGGTRYQQHWVYDGASDTWSATPADVPDAETWGARAHVHDNRLYLLGGFPGGRRFRVYDSATNAWTNLTAAPVDFEWGFASGVINGSLYAFGGSSGKATNGPGYRYDLTAGTWSAVAPIPENRGRGALASAVVGTRLFVLNGNQEPGLTYLQIYDTVSNTWARGADLPEHGFEAAATAVVGSQIYFMGGATDQDHADSSATTPVQVCGTLNIYDVAMDSWSMGPAVPEPRMWAAAQLYRGRIHVMGGLDALSQETPHHHVLAR